MKPSRTHENRLRKQGFRLIAGVDEAGRGSLAGPIVAAAVILRSSSRLPHLRDSKQLTARQRETLYHLIRRQALSYSVASVSQTLIDRHGITWANRMVMLQAIKKLKQKPDYLLLDALSLPKKFVAAPQASVIKGDSKIYSIAAASIMAKVTRDRMFIKYHRQYPTYGFNQHKGYGTAYHRAMIIRYGPCPIHRHTFQPLASLIFS